MITIENFRDILRIMSFILDKDGHIFTYTGENFIMSLRVKAG